MEGGLERRLEDKEKEHMTEKAVGHTGQGKQQGKHMEEERKVPVQYSTVHECAEGCM